MPVKGIGFIKSVALNGGGAVFTQGATIILILILANLFGPEGLAKFFVTQNTVNTVAAALQFGLAFTALTFVARHHITDADFANSVIRFCLSAAFASTLVASVVLALLANTIAVEIYGDEQVLPYILLAAAATPFSALAMVQFGILNGLERYVSIFWTSAAAAAGMILASFAGGIGWGVFGAAAGFALSTAARALMLQYSVSRHMPVTDALQMPAGQIWSRVRSFAVPAGLAGLSLTPSTWLASAILLNNRGLEELGLFLAAMSIKTAIFFIPQQIGSTFLPRYIKQRQVDERAAKRNFWYVLSLMAATTISLSAVILLFQTEILSIFGDKFERAAPFLGWLLLAAVLETVALAFSNLYAAHNRMWAMLLLYTFPKDVLLVLAAYFAVPEYGGTGLAFAYVVSTIYGLLSYILIANIRGGHTVEVRHALHE